MKKHWIAIFPALAIIVMALAKPTTGFQVPKKSYLVLVLTNRSYIDMDGVVLFQISDKEWAVLTNAYKEKLKAPNHFKFYSTNDWARRNRIE